MVQWKAILGFVIHTLQKHLGYLNLLQPHFRWSQYHCDQGIYQLVRSFFIT